MPFTNYYQILGLSENASLKEIKAAYRKMAKHYHPDVNPTPNAKQQFIRINEAYQCILNERKNKYDARPVSDEEYQRKKEEAFRNWQKQYEQDARKAAEEFANQSFEEFSNSDVFKSASIFYFKKALGCVLVAIPLIIFIIYFLLTSYIIGIILFLLFIPILSFVLTWIEQHRVR